MRDFEYYTGKSKKMVKKYAFYLPILDDYNDNTLISFPDINFQSWKGFLFPFR